MNTILPSPFDRFTWLGGIENTFIPQERPGLRALEEFELTQHYRQWRQDLERAQSLGIKAIRWGPPWYKVEPEPGRFDWSWVDQVLEHMICRLHITPVLDLMHYGTPFWLENSFINPDYPDRVAAYAAAFTERYRQLVRFYTPLNEPTVNALLCGKRAEWPPYLSGDNGYVAVLLPIARGIQKTVQAVSDIQSDPKFVCVEALRRVKPIGRRSTRAAAHERLYDFLAYDLATGAVSEEHPLYGWLVENGASTEMLSELNGNGIEYDIAGVNFYPWSFAAVEAKKTGGEAQVSRGVCGGGELFHVLKEAARHMRKPLIVTETSATGTMLERKRWMRATTGAVKRAQAAGIDVVGYTWFPLFSMIGWEYRASGKPIDEHLLHLGLWDCRFDDDRTLLREETPMVNEFRRHTLAA